MIVPGQGWMITTAYADHEDQVWIPSPETHPVVFWDMKGQPWSTSPDDTTSCTPFSTFPRGPGWGHVLWHPNGTDGSDEWERGRTMTRAAAEKVAFNLARSSYRIAASKVGDGDE